MELNGILQNLTLKFDIFNMEIKKLSESDLADFHKLIEIFTEVFEVEQPVPHKNHLAAILSNKYFNAFVVRINEKVVGGLTLYRLENYFDEKSIGYIYDVAITPEFQQRGLGKKLISEVCSYCRNNNFKEIFVQAEGTDYSAVGFYKKTGVSEEIKANHFVYKFK